MEYIGTSYSNMIDDEIYYFVNKIIAFPEFKEFADLLACYVIYAGFEKACNICSIDDCANRKQLLIDVKQRRLARIPHWLPIVRPSVRQNIREKHPLQITGMVNRWLVELRAAALN